MFDAAAYSSFVCCARMICAMVINAVTEMSTIMSNVIKQPYVFAVLNLSFFSTECQEMVETFVLE